MPLSLTFEVSHAHAHAHAAHPRFSLCEHKGRLEELQRELDRDPSAVIQEYPVPGQDEAVTTALYTAARAGNAPAVQLLLDRDADVNFQTLEGNTALHVACYRGHLDVVRAIAARREQAHPARQPGLALPNCYGEVCTDTIAADAETARQIRACLGAHDPRALLEAAAGRGGAPLDVLRAFVEDPGAWIDQEFSAGGRGPGSREDSPSRGSPPPARGRRGPEPAPPTPPPGGAPTGGAGAVTLCAHAARHGHAAAVELLLAHGASLRGAAGGPSVLEAAALHGHGAVVGLLLQDAGTDPAAVLQRHADALGPGVTQALLDAVDQRHREAEEERQAQALREARRRLAALPLAEAALAVCTEPDLPKERLVEFLEADPANVDALFDHDGQGCLNPQRTGRGTLLYKAARLGLAECVRLVLWHGAAADRACGYAGATALHTAAFWGHAEVVRALVEAGADPTRGDDHQKKAGEGFHGTVAADARDEIRRVLREAEEAQERRRKELQRQAFEAYLPSLGRRRVGNVRGAAQAEEKVGAVSAADGVEGLMNGGLGAVLGSALALCIAGDRGGGGGADPVSRMYRAALGREAACAARAVRGSAWEDWYAVPEPGLFPEAVLTECAGARATSVEEMVARVHLRALRALGHRLRGGLFSQRRALQAALDAEIDRLVDGQGDGRGTEDSVAAAAAALGKFIWEQCHGVARATLGAQGAQPAPALLVRTAVEAALPRLRDEYDGAPGLYPRCGILRAMVESPAQVRRLLLAQADAAPGAPGCVAELLRETALPAFGAAQEPWRARAQAIADAVKRRTDLLPALQSLDALAVEMLQTRPLEAAREWLRAGGWATPPHTTGADAMCPMIRTEYAKYALRDVCRDAVRRYRAPDAALHGTAPHHRLVDREPWSQGEFAPALLGYGAVRGFVAGKAGEAQPKKATHAPSWAMFREFATKGLKPPAAGAAPSFHDVLRGYLRPLALHYTWAHFPAYERVTEVGFQPPQNVPHGDCHL